LIRYDNILAILQIIKHADERLIVGLGYGFIFCFPQDWIESYLGYI
jgi:hypothetical protein